MLNLQFPLPVDASVHDLVFILRERELVSSNSAKDMLGRENEQGRLKALADFIQTQPDDIKDQINAVLASKYPSLQIKDTKPDLYQDDTMLVPARLLVQSIIGRQSWSQADEIHYAQREDVIQEAHISNIYKISEIPPTQITAQVRCRCTAFSIPFPQPSLYNLPQSPHSLDLFDQNTLLQYHTMPGGTMEVDDKEPVVLYEGDILFVHLDDMHSSNKEVTAVDISSRRLLVPRAAIKMSDDPSDEEWLYPRPISSKQAAIILTRTALAGTFVVYQRARNPSFYSLSVCGKCKRIFHYHIQGNRQGGFSIAGNPRFDSIKQLVSFYKYNRGVLCRKLRYTPKSASEEPDPYKSSVKDLIFGMDNMIIRDGFLPKETYVHGTMVSIDLANCESTSRDYQMDFLDAAATFKSVNHDNIANFVGVYWDPPVLAFLVNNSPTVSLIRYLQGKHINPDDIDTFIGLFQQVLSVLEYFENCRFILHRDFGAHSWKVAENGCLQLANFHLARYVYTDEYTMEEHEQVSVRWAAPEVLQTGVFSTKSEIWAAGVLLWQMFTHNVPYSDMGNRQVIDAIIHGKRLSPPPLTPLLFTRALDMCWEQTPARRPTAGMLSTTLRSPDDLARAPSQEELYEAHQDLYEDNLVIMETLKPLSKSQDDTKFSMSNKNEKHSPSSNKNEKLRSPRRPYFRNTFDNVTEVKTLIGNACMKDGEISVDCTWNIRAIDPKNRRKFETQDCYSPPRHCVSDFILGDLKTCLRNKLIDVDDKALLVDICRQLSEALAFFSAKAYVIHRNLRAQSCLVRAPSNDVVVCDFGLAQFVEGEDNYMSSTTESVPLRWCAPEVLREGTYSTKSDIWAMGILFWEVFSGGRMPFKELTNEKLAFMMVDRNEPPLLQFPDNCPRAIQDIMRLCCSLEPGRRPNAHSINDSLRNIIEQKTWDKHLELPLKVDTHDLFTDKKRIDFTAVFSQTPMMLCPKECILGDLQYWLQSGHLDRVEKRVTLSLCSQVFSALQFMYEQRYILHRHIIPLNCLIATDGKLKLCDGGLARKVTVDYYRPTTEDWRGFDGRLPLRFCAPETAGGDPGISTTKSDIWMAAVLCWTIYSKGRTPFSELATNWNAVEAILDGRRLNKPTNCPQNVFDLISKCWATEPGDRPLASEMLDWLSEAMQDE